MDGPLNVKNSSQLLRNSKPLEKLCQSWGAFKIQR